MTSVTSPCSIIGSSPCDVQDLIKQLLARDPNRRLGARGATEIKLHPWFNCIDNPIDWQELAQQKLMYSPFIPQVSKCHGFRHACLLLHIADDQIAFCFSWKMIMIPPTFILSPSASDQWPMTFLLKIMDQLRYLHDDVS